MKINEIARQVFKLESKEILGLCDLLTEDFESAIRAISETKGKLIISGMGKSGLVGRKIAATLTSTGTSSFSMHPCEAYHGDLGMIDSLDIVLLISNSGETDEVLKLIPFLKSQGNKTISMSGNPQSTLAKNTDYHLNIAVQKEACPLQLAPTSSTTATIVMGDAIAVSLMQTRDFLAVNFLKFHPGGSLGKKLLVEVKDVMKTRDMPICHLKDSIKDVIYLITQGGSGIGIVLEDEKIIGVISDGDLRKAMENEKLFFTLTAKDIMNSNPKTILYSKNLTDAYDMMGEERVNTLVVVGECGELQGTIQSHDVNI
jgi:arabinose-5-phosphate isomerase